MCGQSLSRVSLCDPMDCIPPGSSVHGDSPGKNTGMRCRAFLQAIFPTQGSKPRLLHCKQILYHWAMGKAAISSPTSSKFKFCISKLLMSLLVIYFISTTSAYKDQHICKLYMVIPNQSSEKLSKLCFSSILHGESPQPTKLKEPLRDLKNCTGWPVAWPSCRERLSWPPV